MDILQAIVLGIVQGLTEFLPISSTAHIRIVPALLGWSDPGAAFTAVIQLGTLLAVLVYFWSDLLRAIGGWARSLKGGEAAKTDEARLGWAVFWGTIPVVVLGLLLHDKIEGSFRSLNVIALALIAVALLMLLAERFAKHTREMKEVRPLDGIVVGLWQALALVPGASRSGTSITGALFSGFNRETAARFSFLLSVPAVLLAGLYELFKARAELGAIGVVPIVVATAASFIVGYASIGFLLKFLRTRSTAAFAIYRIALGLFLLVSVAQLVGPK